MVSVEFAFHHLQVEVVFGVSVPGQVEHVVEIGILNRVIGCLRVEAFEFAQFFIEMFLHVLVPLHFGAAFVQLLDVVHIGTKFLLDSAYLLLKEVVALLLGQFLACAGLDIGFDFHQLLLTHEQGIEQVSAFLDVTFLKHVLFLVRVKGDIGGEEIHQVHGVIDVFHRKSQFTAVVAHVAQHAQCYLGNRLHQHLKLFVTC